MYVHQALPKEIPDQTPKPRYQIRKRPSPAKQNNKNSPKKNKKDKSQENKGEVSSKKKEMHRIASKDKPDVSSAEKNRLPTPKRISTVCFNRSKEKRESS